MIKLGVIFGGVSNEHDVSVLSGKSIIHYLDRQKYEIYPIYIDKKGIWFTLESNCDDFEIKDCSMIDDIFTFLKSMDVIFPVLHGKFGEDGTIQGMLEMLNIPYVGCGVIASSIAMDKVYTKIILNTVNIKQTKYQCIKKNKNKYVTTDKKGNELELTLQEITSKIEDFLEYPIFVKPASSGSSIGVNKVYNKKELENSIIEACKIDKKVLFEETIVGREIECAVLGNDSVKASCVGEIKPANDFYTFDAKYNNKESKLIIPAEISDETANKIKNIAIKAFKVISGKGLARVDFFVNEKTNDIYLNEINTMPGFTNISMYPKLWEKSGLSYSSLLDKLINLAIEEKK